MGFVFLDLSFMRMFCKRGLSFCLFFLPLCCLSFFDLRILITLFVSSKFSGLSYYTRCASLYSTPSMVLNPEYFERHIKIPHNERWEHMSCSTYKPSDILSRRGELLIFLAFFFYYYDYWRNKHGRKINKTILTYFSICLEPIK
jgi:hypothetical protein